MKKLSFIVIVLVAGFLMTGCNDSDSSGTSMKTLAAYIESGATEEGATNRVLVVDTRPSADYIEGHITDALSIPYDMIAEDDMPLYTNNYDEVSPTASDQIADSWLRHMLVNQLINDFVSTYQNSEIIFYGDNAKDAEKIAKKIGYVDVDHLSGSYEKWAAQYPNHTEKYGPGVVSANKENGSFIFTGFINNTNNDNVSTRPTHHGVTYKGGALSFYSYLLTDTPPFIFHEILMYLGVSPEGKMADGIYYGPEEEYASKYPDGDRIDYFVTWENAGRYYALEDLFEEGPSEFHPDPDNFELLGIEARMGGTRDSNLQWNPGCIFCMYACVCGISSNDKANEETWFADGGIYDPFGQPDNERNYYAGRYFPKSELMPGPGEPIKIKVVVVK
jgi:rhodanese-related sulfurtransferase